MFASKASEVRAGCSWPVSWHSRSRDGSKVRGWATDFAPGDTGNRLVATQPCVWEPAFPVGFWASLRRELGIYNTDIKLQIKLKEFLLLIILHSVFLFCSTYQNRWRNWDLTSYWDDSRGSLHKLLNSWKPQVYCSCSRTMYVPLLCSSRKHALGYVTASVSPQFHQMWNCTVRALTSRRSHGRALQTHLLPTWALTCWEAGDSTRLFDGARVSFLLNRLSPPLASRKAKRQN